MIMMHIHLLVVPKNRNRLRVHGAKDLQTGLAIGLPLRDHETFLPSKLHSPLPDQLIQIMED